MNILMIQVAPVVVEAFIIEEVVMVNFAKLALTLLEVEMSEIQFSRMPWPFQDLYQESFDRSMNAKIAACFRKEISITPVQAVLL